VKESKHVVNAKEIMEKKKKEEELALCAAESHSSIGLTTLKGGRHDVRGKGS